MTGTVGEIGVLALYHAEKVNKLPNEESGSVLKMEAEFVLAALDKQNVVDNHHVPVSIMNLLLQQSAAILILLRSQ